MSFSFVRQGKFHSRRAMIYGLGLFSLGALSISNYYVSQAKNHQLKLAKAKGRLEKFEVANLGGADAASFPW